MKVDELLKLSKEDLVGKVICFPTDTVYGVGVLVNDVEGANRIYQMKKRSENKPLAYLASSIDDILPYIDNLPEKVRKIATTYWPGALTIVFNKNKKQRILINPDIPTIGFRIPHSDIALKILKKFGVMATTSINLSGEVPLNDYKTIKEHFGAQIDYLIEEDDEPKSNVSSTVIDATKEEIIVLRQGDIKIN
ncbi:MAG: L-threonylcarbamoyladenylate synthase [Bacilli bacterium]